MNDYYNAATKIARQSKARSPAVNAIFTSIAAAFDLLPGKDKLHQGRVTHYADTGAADAYVVTMDPVPTSYEDGLHVRVVIANTNTGAATINVNALGARSIKMFDNADPAAGDITAGDIVDFVYHNARSAFMAMGQSRSVVSAADAARAAAVVAKDAAETAASNSSTSAGNSSTSASNAAATYVNFQKYYLGEKASDPTLDNAGAALINGAFYWKTGVGLRAYDGTDFNGAILDPAGAVMATNDLSDLNDAPTAVANLGFSIAAAEISEAPARSRIFSLWIGA